MNNGIEHYSKIKYPVVLFFTLSINIFNHLRFDWDLYQWYYSAVTMSTNKEHIECVEVKIGSLQDGMKRIEQGLIDRLQSFKRNNEQAGRFTFNFKRDAKSQQL